jgi:hypothetical protein
LVSSILFIAHSVKIQSTAPVAPFFSLPAKTTMSTLTKAIWHHTRADHSIFQIIFYFPKTKSNTNPLNAILWNTPKQKVYVQTQTNLSI